MSALWAFPFPGLLVGGCTAKASGRSTTAEECCLKEKKTYATYTKNRRYFHQSIISEIPIECVYIHYVLRHKAHVDERSGFAGDKL